ncbi:hypothetical protein Misp06_01080 [Microbulbifer sp. NBRC 101763]|uniref:hypothetical protein n=1 Tax=unclassified Microbulbifer TaxID=2619833 RepID=UPI0030AFC976
MARGYLRSYPFAVRLSPSALSNLAIVQLNYAYTGVMEITTGIIDLCGAAGTNPHYNTRTPIKHDIFPQFVGTHNVAPIVHGGRGSGNTSHQQLARVIMAQNNRLASSEDDFCGFTIRFNGKPNADFSGTSRSLNMGIGFSNGELELCLRNAIMQKVASVIRLYGWTNLTYAPPRADPNAANAARGRGIHAAGLLASIQQLNRTPAI